MSKKIMLLSLGSLAVATAVAVPVAVVLSGDSTKATTTGGAGTTPTPTTTGEPGKTGTTGEPGKTGTTGGVKMPSKAIVPKLKHFDTADEFNKHPFVTDVKVAKDGTEKEIVDQKGDFERNEFIFASGTKELSDLLGTLKLEDLNKNPLPFLEQMKFIIIDAIKDSSEFTDVKNAIVANEKLEDASKSIDDAAVISVNLARLKGSATADSIVININHASLSDAKKILKAAKTYLESDVQTATAQLGAHSSKNVDHHVITQAENNKVYGELPKTMPTLEGLFDRLINSI